MKQAISLEGTGVILELSKITSVKLKQRMIHLDELADGTWRLTYNHVQIPDYTRVTGIRISNGKFEIEGVDQQFDVKVIAVKTTQNMIHFDEFHNGQWKLMYNKEKFPNFAAIERMAVIRLD